MKTWAKSRLYFFCNSVSPVCNNSPFLRGINVCPQHLPVLTHTHNNMNNTHTPRRHCHVINNLIIETVARRRRVCVATSIKSTDDSIVICMFFIFAKYCFLPGVSNPMYRGYQLFQDRYTLWWVFHWRIYPGDLYLGVNSGSLYIRVSICSFGHLQNNLFWKLGGTPLSKILRVTPGGSQIKEKNTTCWLPVWSLVTYVVRTAH